MNILFVSYQIPSTRDPQSGSFNKSRIESLSKFANVILIVPTIISPSVKYLLPLPKFKLFFKDMKNKCSSKIFQLKQNIEVYQVFYFKPPKAFWQIEDKFEIYSLKKTLDKILNNKEIDLIITSGINHDTLSLCGIKKLKNVPHYAIAEGSDVYINLKKNKKKKRYYETKLNKRKTTIIAVSGELELFIKHNYKFNRIKRIENGFENAEFKYSRKPINNPPVFTSVGRLEKVKGYDILIDALSLLKFDFKMNIIAKGSEKENLETQIKVKKLSSKIKLLGYQNRDTIKEYLSQSSLFIISSRYESFCIAAAEALGVGVPVVGPNVGGIKNLVTDNANGFRFNVEDPIDLSKKIVLGLNKKWDYKAISEHAHQNYTWTAWAKKIINLQN